VEPCGDQVCFTVSDTGISFDEVRQRLFAV
jgi:hypothetical protein